MKLIRWNIPEGDTIIPKRLVDAGYTSLLAAMLSSRGIKEPEDAERFISGSGKGAITGFPIGGLAVAAERIRLAAVRGEKVAVFGDYDVDGITSTALMSDFLRRHMKLNCISYIPDRLKEGYGLNKDAVRMLAERGISLIITVDCGITAVEEVEYAASLGLDMIITDHHECQGKLPEAAAVVDPKRDDAPGGHILAGVGVAFRLAMELAPDGEAIFREYADLVAVGTIADVMPLTDENRFIVRAGLEKISSDPRPGIAALLAEAGLDSKKISAGGIGFALAPRLNAAGRLGQAGRAYELLMETDADKAASLASELCELNRLRQSTEHEIWLQALEKLKDRPLDRPIVLCDENWHQGVVGIVASRLSEAYSLPTIMICLDGGKGKGSCRSVGDFNLFGALAACSEHLESFGGHAAAAGLNIAEENIAAFDDALAAYYAENPPHEMSLDFDLRIDDTSMLTVESVQSLDMLEPCGNGNPRARMCMVGAELESVISMGAGRHLRLTVIKGGQRLECVYFSHTEKDVPCAVGEKVDLAFYPQVNEYRSRSSVQLVITDMRKTDVLSLSQRALLGLRPKYGEGADMIPARGDSVRLWRYLEKRAGFSGTLMEIASEFRSAGLVPETAFASLRVFSETGLIKLETDGDMIKIKVLPSEGKADLESAPYMSLLRRPTVVVK